MEIAWFSCCKYKLQQATTTPDNSCDQANGESDFLQVAAAPTAVAMPQAFAPSLSPGTTPYDDCNGLYTYMKTTHSTTHCSLIVWCKEWLNCNSSACCWWCWRDWRRDRQRYCAYRTTKREGTDGASTASLQRLFLRSARRSSLPKKYSDLPSIICILCLSEI